MSFGTYARRVRNRDLSYGQRYLALRCAVERYCPLGFNATWAYISAAAQPDPDLRCDEDALLRALSLLEDSRSAWLDELRSFQARRRTEKATGRRSPHQHDVQHFQTRRWPGSAPVSKKGLQAALAQQWELFSYYPFPDEALGVAVDGLNPRMLYATVTECVEKYLEAHGRLDEEHLRALAAATVDLERFVLRGYNIIGPLNSHFVGLLRLAHVIGFAARASCP